MIVIVKSAPDTADGMRGVTLAKDGNADLVLLQNGVLFAQKKRLGDFPGTVYVLDDDKRLRGMKDSEIDDRVKAIDYDRLTDLMMESDKVVGMF
jgi:sulfur relay protein TusB/DsrH